MEKIRDQLLQQDLNTKLTNILDIYEENEVSSVDNFILFNDAIIILCQTLDECDDQIEECKNTITKLRINSKQVNMIVLIDAKYRYQIINIQQWKHFNRVKDIHPNIDKNYAELKELFNIGSNNNVMQISSNIMDIKTNKILKKDIQKFNQRVYIHATTSLNLSNIYTFKRKGAEIRRNLKQGNEIGCRGVVIHVGKFEDKIEGRQLMEINIKYLLKYATVQCPLILETPAGQGDELLTTLNSFANFYLQNKEDNFKICIDTAHVFALGYMPFNYLSRMITKVGAENIALVHLNDSMRYKGSKVDRHQHVGYGFIGFTELEKVIIKCDEHNIDMVEEW